jgi:replicative DNA helicase
MEIDKLPNSPELEEQVVASLLLDPMSILRIIDLVKPEHFYWQQFRLIYKAIFEIHTVKGVEFPTPTIILDELSSIGQLDAVGGASALNDLWMNVVVSSSGIEDCARKIRDKAILREFILACQKAEQLAATSTKPIDELLAEGLSMVADVAISATQKTLEPLSGIVTETFKTLEARAAGEISIGLNTGFYDFDGMTNGVKRQDLVVVAGRPSMGKTTWSLNVARHIARTNRLPVAIFSMEMSKDKLASKLLSLESRIDGSRLDSGSIQVDEWEHIGHGIARMSGLPIFIDDSSDITVPEMRAKLKRLQFQTGGAPLGAVLLDYIQLMEGDDDRIRFLSKVTRSLKKLARDFDVPVLALSQLSRSPEHRTNKRPVQADLRESGAIEQDADLIIMLYRDEVYHPDTPDTGIAEIIVVKNREGPIGTKRLLFEGRYSQFLNLSS